FLQIINKQIIPNFFRCVFYINRVHTISPFLITLKSCKKPQIKTSSYIGVRRSKTVIGSSSYLSGVTKAGIDTVLKSMLTMLQRANPYTSLDKKNLTYKIVNITLSCFH